MPEDLRGTSRNRSHEGVRTLVPEYEKDRSLEGVPSLVPGPADGAVATGLVEKYEDDNNNNLPRLDLKPLTESDPKTASRQPQNKVKGKQAKQKPIALNLGGRGPATGPPNPTAGHTSGPSKANPNYNKATQFEDDFFANTSRTEPRGDNIMANSRYLLDPSMLSSYKPVDEINGGYPKTDMRQAANAHPVVDSGPGSNVQRPLPLPRPTALVAGATT